MVMDWFGYSLTFPGRFLVGPVLGSVVFWWGGQPFLTGAVDEIRSRRPGMMLLIAMAITVAYTASMLTTFEALDLDFWWELATLVTVMLLGHWQEMKAIGQAQGALAALAALLPDEAERVGPDGAVATVAVGELAPRRRRAACARAGGSPPTGWSSRARPRWTSRWSPASPGPCPVPRATPSWPAPCRPGRRCGSG